jgi:hypothetical protein
VKSSTLVAILTRLTIAMAIAAPLVVFGFLYVLQVVPERAAALEARARLGVARRALNRQPLLVRSGAVGNEASALDEFDARTAHGDRAAEAAEALTALLNSPAVGGVSNLSIETGAPSDLPIESMSGLFPQKVMHTPVTVTFDARYEQVSRFFWNLRLLPTTFDLRSLELGAAPHSAMMRAKATLAVFHRPVETPSRSAPQPQMVDVITAPERRRDSPAMPRDSGVAKASRSAAAVPPEPVVSSILFSSGRRIALVDGRIVRPGDRLPAGVVRSIEPDAVVITTAGGQTRRFAIERPVIHMARRACVISPCVPM